MKRHGCNSVWTPALPGATPRDWRAGLAVRGEFVGFSRPPGILTSLLFFSAGRPLELWRCLAIRLSSVLRSTFCMATARKHRGGKTGKHACSCTIQVTIQILNWVEELHFPRCAPPPLRAFCRSHRRPEDHGYANATGEQTFDKILPRLYELPFAFFIRLLARSDLMQVDHELVVRAMDLFS